MSARSLAHFAFVAGLVLPNAAGAQATTGNIVGVVRDTSGGVLPGVTVEVVSPALIEKIRTVVTDEQGQYRIVDLPPGTYTVSFTLQAFTSLRREGVELRSGFTASVNAELKVGTVEETVTVAGENPIVDVQNVRGQNVLSREHLDTLPSNRTVGAYAAFTVGLSAFSTGTGALHDVGGNKGERAARLVFSGSRFGDGRYYLDGMSTMQGDSPSRFFFVNQVAAQEINVTTHAAPAEQMTGGVTFNVIPKSGGNVFSGYFSANHTGPKWQSTNLNDDLRDRGLTTPTKIRRVYDFGAGLGGPLAENKVWFFTAHRYWGASEYAPGNYFNATQGTLFYTPDYSRPAYNNLTTRDNSGRITWQATQKQRFTFFGSNQGACLCYGSVDQNTAPEAHAEQGYFPVLIQSAWTYPATNKFLIEVGGSYMHNGKTAHRGPETSPGDISILEALGTSTVPGGYRYGAATSYSDCSSVVGCPDGYSPSARASMTYLTGSHALKVGFQWIAEVNYQRALTSNVEPPVSYTFRGQLPNSVTYYMSPTEGEWGYSVQGFYLQDLWTMGDVTLNYGLRYDYTRGWYPAQSTRGGAFVGPIEFAARDNVPNWKDISPRFGASWDVFGNGNTAIKGFIGRYVEGGAMADRSPLTGAAGVGRPDASIVTSATRTWNDVNRDFVPQENELGPLSPATFGTSVITTRVDPTLVEGFGVRPYNWQADISLQHSLGRGLNLSAGYYRRWFGNQAVTDNLRDTPGDYDPFCVTVPGDPRLPGGGGNEICGLYDIKPSLFGQIDNLVVSASKFGEIQHVFNGFDMSITSRFRRGGMIAGGFSTGSTTIDGCSVRPNSPDTNFCRNTFGFKGQLQIKAQFVYPLPGDFEVSGVFQNLPGIPIGQTSDVSAASNRLVTRSYTNNEVRSSLGRNLAACGTREPCTSTVTVQIMEANQVFEDRLNQLDLRLTRIFRFGPTRLQARFDAYNIFNNAAILFENYTYGPSFMRPTAIQGARLFKIGLQLDF